MARKAATSGKQQTPARNNPRGSTPRGRTSRATGADDNTPTLPRAGLGVRLITLTYDGLLLLALAFVINTLIIIFTTPAQAAASSALTILSPEVRHMVMFPATVLVVFAFYGYCWTRSGQTLGMQTWRLELRRRDGRLLTWQDSFRRFVAAAMVPTLCGLASWLLHPDDTRAYGLSIVFGFVLNYLWLLVPSNSGKGCLHDKLSNTEVLRVPVKPKTRKPYRFLGLFGDKLD